VNLQPLKIYFLTTLWKCKILYQILKGSLMVYNTLNDRVTELCPSFIIQNNQTTDKVQKPSNFRLILNIFPLGDNNGCFDTKNWSSLYCHLWSPHGWCATLLTHLRSVLKLSLDSFGTCTSQSKRSEDHDGAWFVNSSWN
jgi:hypothetical protein